MNNFLKFSLLTITILTGVIITSSFNRPSQDKPKISTAKADSAKRQEDLQYILSILPPDRTSFGRVSYHDQVFTDWLTRTGELPPNWDSLPSIPYLPDPLMTRKNGKNTPITTLPVWKNKRKELKQQLQYYITGTYPEQPNNLKADIISERIDGEVMIRIVELSFGPNQEAKLTVELMIPPGKGPLPVFLTQWNHREWAQIAVKRGYIGCVYAAADAKDDTEDYARIWDNHDFTRLMRRAYGTFVAVDYLYTLPQVDKKKIGITGHSRNGKLSLIAAAFDERITAVVTSSGGSGAEVPWRYAAYPYDVEDIALLTTAQPAWFHPRLRFFTGRENKLPIDQNSFMALVAPRGLMLSTAVSESASNPWGAEQALKSAQTVYNFLQAKDQVMIRYRNGLHGTAAKEIEGYVDFFDFVFKRNSMRPASDLMHPYSFAGWKAKSKEQINPLTFPKKGIDQISTARREEVALNTELWQKDQEKIQDQLRWLLGVKPPLVSNLGPQTLKNQGAGEEYAGTFLKRPSSTKKMEVMKITPYKGFGDGLFGYLYYPAGSINKKKVPVVIYLHEYDYGKGFTPIGLQHELQSFFDHLVDQGYAVFSYDMLGFGNRIEEGIRFYDRHPQWSKMGKMVADVDAAVLALENLEFIDGSKIYTAGYSLGATVGLCAAALNKHIAGTIAVAGFTPMRTDLASRGTNGIRFYSHEHGLIPRLGFFVGQEAHIPVDFQDIIASIAPRPALIVAPLKDWTTSPDDIKVAVTAAQNIYRLYSAEKQLELITPNDYNRFSPATRELIFEWLKKR